MSPLVALTVKFDYRQRETIRQIQTNTAVERQTPGGIDPYKSIC